MTSAAIAPTTSPPRAQGIAAAGLASTAANVRDQVKQAEPRAMRSRNSVLWAVPLIVITSAEDRSLARSWR
jgi:hypothetical protein